MGLAIEDRQHQLSPTATEFPFPLTTHATNAANAAAASTTSTATSPTTSYCPTRVLKKKLSIAIPKVAGLNVTNCNNTSTKTNPSTETTTTTIAPTTTPSTDKLAVGSIGTFTITPLSTGPPVIMSNSNWSRMTRSSSSPPSPSYQYSTSPSIHHPMPNLPSSLSSLHQSQSNPNLSAASPPPPEIPGLTSLSDVTINNWGWDSIEAMVAAASDPDATPGKRLMGRRSFFKMFGNGGGNGGAGGNGFGGKRGEGLSRGSLSAGQVWTLDEFEAGGDGVSGGFDVDAVYHGEIEGGVVGGCVGDEYFVGSVVGNVVANAAGSSTGSLSDATTITNGGVDSPLSPAASSSTLYNYIRPTSLRARSTSQPSIVPVGSSNIQQQQSSSPAPPTPATPTVSAPKLGFLAKMQQQGGGGQQQQQRSRRLPDFDTLLEGQDTIRVSLTPSMLDRVLLSNHLNGSVGVTGKVEVLNDTATFPAPSPIERSKSATPSVYGSASANGNLNGGNGGNKILPMLAGNEGTQPQPQQVQQLQLPQQYQYLYSQSGAGVGGVGGKPAIPPSYQTHAAGTGNEGASIILKRSPSQPNPVTKTKSTQGRESKEFLRQTATTTSTSASTTTQSPSRHSVSAFISPAAISLNSPSSTTSTTTSVSATTYVSPSPRRTGSLNVKLQQQQQQQQALRTSLQYSRPRAATQPESEFGSGNGDGGVSAIRTRASSDTGGNGVSGIGSGVVPAVPILPVASATAPSSGGGGVVVLQHGPRSTSYNAAAGSPVVVSMYPGPAMTTMPPSILKRAGAISGGSGGSRSGSGSASASGVGSVSSDGEFIKR
ncbi:hypothetical protein HDU76_002938 [Blyttiomyces sp. JEL0837]|nr:hypothetical protein HDU76_002938 [Blyttiomyces sp. JEL0837]